MKRTISLLLCFVLTLSMLTGCANREQTRYFIKDLSEVADEYAQSGYFDTATGSQWEPSDATISELMGEIAKAQIRSYGYALDKGGASDDKDDKEVEDAKARLSDSAEDIKSKVTAKASDSDTSKTAAAKAAPPKAGKYPISWKLEDIYEKTDDWYKDYDRAEELVGRLGDFKGTLNTARGIYNFVSFYMDSELTEICSKLSLYTELLSALDSADSTAMDMDAKLSQLGTKELQAVSYVDEEIYELSLSERKKIFSDPVLKKYAYALRDYTDEDAVHHSEETVNALALKSGAEGAGYDIFSTLRYADLPVPEIEMPDGETVYLTQDVLSEIISGDYDHDFKLEAYNTSCGKYAAFANTFAKTLEYTIRENIGAARLEGYDSFAEYAFDAEDVEPEIYEKMKKAVHEMLPDLHKYMACRKKQSGYDHFDIVDATSIKSGYDDSTTYDESCGVVLEALSVLGKDYTDAAAKVIKSGHIDVYPGAGKTTGGFAASCNNKDVLPYILLNYTGDMDSTTTLCHEMGHAMYAYFSENNSDLNKLSSSPTIFTHEVASTTNEFLLAYNRIDNAGSEEEKAAYLDYVICLIQGTVIRQMMYAEFEEYLYDTVEAGGALDAETISDKWIELSREYFGEDVDYIDNYRYSWAGIPHFYMGYYVYKYATSCTYAAAASHNIYSGDKNAIADYRRFLTLGNSAKPSELLKVAGVDPLDDRSYDYIKDMFSEYVETYCKNQ